MDKTIPTLTPENYNPHLTAIALFVTISVLSSNLLNLLVIYHMKKARPTTRILYTSLSFSDLICGVTLTFFISSVKTGQWQYSRTLCTITGYFVSVAASVSVYTMCVLSIERCIIITRPFDSYRFIRKRYATIAVALVWLICCSGAIWSIYSKVGNLYEFRTGSLICSLAYNKSFNTWLYGFIMVICVTFLVVSVSWIRIFYFVIQNHRQRAQLSGIRSGPGDIHLNESVARISSVSTPSAPSSPSKPKSTQSSSKPGRFGSRISQSSRASSIRRQLLTILLMILGFYISWIPFIVRQFQLAIRKSGESIWPDFFFGWTALSNGFWNSWIYCLTDRTFRNTLLRLCKNFRKFCIRLICPKKFGMVEFTANNNEVQL